MPNFFNLSRLKLVLYSVHVKCDVYTRPYKHLMQWRFRFVEGELLTPETSAFHSTVQAR